MEIQAGVQYARSIYATMTVSREGCQAPSLPGAFASPNNSRTVDTDCISWIGGQLRGRISKAMREYRKHLLIMFD